MNRRNQNKIKKRCLCGKVFLSEDIRSHCVKAHFFPANFCHVLCRLSGPSCLSSLDKRMKITW